MKKHRARSPKIVILGSELLLLTILAQHVQVLLEFVHADAVVTVAVQLLKDHIQLVEVQDVAQQVWELKALDPAVLVTVNQRGVLECTDDGWLVLQHGKGLALTEDCVRVHVCACMCVYVSCT